MKKVGQPHMVLFWFLVVPGLICLGLSGGLSVIGGGDQPVVQAAPASAHPSAIQQPPPTSVEASAVVAVSQLSVLNSVPVSNDPALFGAAQAYVVPAGWVLDVVLGRHTVVLENGIRADFLVVDNGGRKALVFQRLIDGTLATSVDDQAFFALPVLPFP